MTAVNITTKHRNMSLYDNYPQSVQLLSLQWCIFLGFWKNIFGDICGLKFLISQELFQKVAMKVFIFRCFFAIKLPKTSESCDKKLQIVLFVIIIELFVGK